MQKAKAGGLPKANIERALAAVCVVYERDDLVCMRSFEVAFLDSSKGRISGKRYGGMGLRGRGGGGGGCIFKEWGLRTMYQKEMAAYSLVTGCALTCPRDATLPHPRRYRATRSQRS